MHPPASVNHPQNPLRRGEDPSPDSLTISGPETEEEQKAFTDIISLLHESSGIDFSHYRNTTVMRRLSRRIGFCRKKDIAHYADYLKNTPGEVRALYHDLLLSFTTFFRDPPIFTSLANQVYPALAVNRSPNLPIRIWVPGCATGEEVYSIAISLLEFLEKNNLKLPLQFFGTDLNEQHIVTARSALYPEKIEKTVSRQRLERFFDHVPGGYRIAKHIRQMCVFSTQNVLSDPPFANIDILSCRNLLIYFDSEFQDQVIPLFHFALNHEGFLILGTSETLSRFEHLFSIADKKGNIYRKVPVKDLRPYQLPFSRTIKKHEDKMELTRKKIPVRNRTNDIESSIDRILLDKFIPPCILVDPSLQIRAFRGAIAPYLAPGSGKATLKLSDMVLDGLMPDLYVAIQETKKSDRIVVKNNVFLSDGSSETCVSLTILPVHPKDGGESGFLIVFHPLQCPQTVIPPDDDNTPTDETEVLRKELMAVKEHLQAIIEEKDEVNQELWAANEEVQSTNEELQSVNEEMEAAKEELESGNEELIALNEELVQSNTAIKKSEDRFKGLVETSSDWIWEVDTSGKYTYSSPMVKQILGYEPDEIIGRTPFDLMPLDEADAFAAMFRSSVSEGKPIISVENVNLHRSGRKAILETSAVPFLDETGEPAGFRGINRDVTERVTITEQLRLNEMRLRRALSIAKMAYWSIDLTGHSDMWSREMFPMFGLDYSETPPPFERFLDRIHPDDRELLRTLTHETARTGASTTVIWRSNPELGPVRTFQAIWDVDRNSDGSIVRIVGTIQDVTSQNALEQQLHENELKFRQIVENTRDLFLVVNLRENRFEFISPVFTSVLGYDPQLITDTNYLLSLVHNDDLPKFRERADLIRAGLKRGVKELPLYIARYRHKDGHYVWLQTSGKIMYDQDGTPAMFIDLARDVTALKQAEEALRISEEKHRLILQETSEMIFAVTPEGIYRFANRAFASTFDTTPEDVVGKKISDLFAADEAEKRYDTIRQTINSGVRKDFELSSIISGEEHFFHAILEPIYNDDGAILWVLGIAHDITERKKALEALRVSEARLKQAQKVAHIGTWTWHIKTNRLEWSEEMYTIFGLEKETVSQGLETVVERAIHPLDRKAVEQSNLSVIHDKKPYPIEYRIIWPDNSIHTVWAEAGELILDAKGNPESLTGIAQDITERKRIEDALLNTQKLESLGVLAGGIAHDFNNLLSGIFGCIDLASDKVTDKDAVSYLSKALGTIDRARALTGQLLTFSKGGTPIKKLQKLPAFIEETVNFALSGSNTSCTFSFPDEVWLCTFDKNQIGQVIDNIVINATHAMPTGGVIDITAENLVLSGNEHPILAAGNYVRIAIRDHGIGIPENVLPKIFDPFYTTKSKGHGLGLATCHSILRRHNGHIEAASQPGEGSTFTFYLPASTDTAVVDTADRAIPHHGSGLILLMDDEGVVTDTVGSMLREMGYTVHGVSDSKSAVRLFRESITSKKHYVALILDLTIPGEPGGKEAIREIRKMDTTTPAFIASGYTEDPVMAHPQDYGFNGCIRKPFRKAELANLFAGHLKNVSPADMTGATDRSSE